MKLGSLRIWLLSGKLVSNMIRVIDYMSEDYRLKHNIKSIVIVAERMLHITVETNMTDTERAEILKRKIEQMLQIAKPTDGYVRVRLTITLIDSLSRKKFDDVKFLYVHVREVKEKYEKYNQERVNDNLIKDLFSDIVEKNSSDISIQDAMELIGISKEESEQYVNKEGNYEYPDLIGKWASLFSKGNNV